MGSIIGTIVLSVVAIVSFILSYRQYNEIGALFERIVKAAGVEKTIQLGTNDASVGFHTLRHTFATRAVENGMDILVLAKILGHAQASTTLNKYGHVLADHLRSSMEKIRPAK